MELWGKPDGGYWEHIDTASDVNSKEKLLTEYRMSFGKGWSFEWRR